MTLADLRALMAKAALPPGLSWAAEAAHLDDDSLFPQEAGTIARAVPKRRAEFTGGRKAARAALGKPVPIPVADSRAPVFPEGWVGSISHEADLCIALVGEAGQWRALGIDLTAAAPLESALVPEICRPEELHGVSQPGQGLLARRLFSAKEAAFKALFPLTGTMFGFHGLCVDRARNVASIATIGETQAIPAPLKSKPVPVFQIEGQGLILSITAIPA